MAARQLLPDRGADPDGAAAPPGWLQPRTAAPGRRPVGRTASRLRHRPRDDLARRRPAGRRRPRRLRLRLPDRDPARHRRAVGHSDHAAARPAGEPPPRGGAGRRRSRGPEPGGLLGRPDDGDRREGPEEPDSRHRGHGEVRPPDGRLVRRGVRPPPAGKEPGAGAAPDVDRTAVVGGRADDRAAGAVGEPAAGGRPGLDQQQHQQPEVPRGRRLARLRRGEERRRSDPAGGSGWRVRADGLRHAGPLPPRRGDDSQAERANRRRGGPSGGRTGPGDRRDRGPRCEGGARRLLPRREGTRAGRTGRARARRGCGSREARGPRPPAAVLSREHRRPHGAARGSADTRSPSGRRAGLARRALRGPPAALREPGGGRLRERRRALAGEARGPAEDGPVGRHPGRLPDARRGADPDHERSERGAPGRSAGGAVSRQSGRTRLVRTADGPG